MKTYKYDDVRRTKRVCPPEFIHGVRVLSQTSTRSGSLIVELADGRQIFVSRGGRI